MGSTSTLLDSNFTLLRYRHCVSFAKGCKNISSPPILHLLCMMMYDVSKKPLVTQMLIPGLVSCVG